MPALDDLNKQFKTLIESQKHEIPSVNSNYNFDIDYSFFKKSLGPEENNGRALLRSFRNSTKVTSSINSESKDIPTICIPRLDPEPSIIV